MVNPIMQLLVQCQLVSDVSYSSASALNNIVVSKYESVDTEN